MRLNLPRVSLNGFLFLLWHCILEQRRVNHSAEGGLPSTGWEVVFTCKLHIFSALPFLSKCHILPPLIVSFIGYFFLKIGIMRGEVRCLAPVTCGSLARLLSTLLRIPLTRVEGSGSKTVLHFQSSLPLDDTACTCRFYPYTPERDQQHSGLADSCCVRKCSLLPREGSPLPSLITVFPWAPGRVYVLLLCEELLRPHCFLDTEMSTSFLEPGSSSSGRRMERLPAKQNAVLAALLP